MNEVLENELKHFRPKHQEAIDNAIFVKSVNNSCNFCIQFRYKNDLGHRKWIVYT